MDREENREIKEPDTIWKRGLYMLLFLFLIGVAKFVTFTVVALQFLFVLFCGAPNRELLTFGQSLSRYTYQVMLFLTFNSEEHPYPLSAWPQQTDP